MERISFIMKANQSILCFLLSLERIFPYAEIKKKAHFT